MEMMWASQGSARFLDGLVGIGRLVVFDRRGVGMSDAKTDWTTSISPHRVSGVAVLDGVDRADRLQAAGWVSGDELGAAMRRWIETAPFVPSVVQPGQAGQPDQPGQPDR
jgi:hypothetical protein